MQSQSHPAKVASTASGMSYEQWKKRPVYKVQCYTASIAYRLCDIDLRPGEGLCTVLGDRRADGLTLFRCLPPYRDEASKALRSRVAQFVVAERRKTRTTHGATALSSNHDSSLVLPITKVAEILAQHEEEFSEHRVGYYPDVERLAEMVRSSKFWTMGEVFVFAQSPQRFVIMKQIAPSSCEMLTITAKGIEDVLTAYLFEQADLVATLNGYLSA